MITVVGLGPARSRNMSVAARDALRAATRLYVRTERHPAVDDLRAEGLSFQTFDSLYEMAQTFDEVYDSIVQAVLDAAATGDVAYAVPGHPLVAEESVRRLLDAARRRDIATKVVGSASFIEPALTAVGAALGAELLLADALALSPESLDPAVPLLIHQVYDARIASDVKLALMRAYPDDCLVDVVRSAGDDPNERVERIPLHALDRVTVDHLTAVYVPALAPETRPKSFRDLVDVMARLRAQGGCPWDREQDHRTLKRYMIEECYEAIDAIDADDMDGLCEELGDVLLQVVFHAQIEAEAGIFTIEDVITHIVEKLIRRHPHVFGEVEVSGSSEVLANWEQIKRSEKGEGWRESLLDGVPSELPALMRSLEIGRRAAKVGFEWERFEDVLAKMDEEIEELRSAIAGGKREEVFDEIGDLLFTIVNVARWQKVDPEDSLRQMLHRFSTRFRHIERRARDRGTSLTDMTLAEMDALWEEAKSKGESEK